MIQGWGKLCVCSHLVTYPVQWNTDIGPVDLIGTKTWSQ